MIRWAFVEADGEDGFAPLVQPSSHVRIAANAPLESGSKFGGGTISCNHGPESACPTSCHGSDVALGYPRLP